MVGSCIAFDCFGFPRWSRILQQCKIRCAENTATHIEWSYCIAFVVPQKSRDFSETATQRAIDFLDIGRALETCVSGICKGILNNQIRSISVDREATLSISRQAKEIHDVYWYVPVIEQRSDNEASILIWKHSDCICLIDPNVLGIVSLDFFSR